MIKKFAIDVVTGFFQVNNEDLMVNDILALFSLTRKYDSGNSMRKGMLGYGWYFDVESNIILRGEVLYIILPDGDEEVFKKNGTEWINVRQGDKHLLIEKQQGVYIVTDLVKRSLYKYDNRGLIREIVDNNGNTTTFIHENDYLNSIRFEGGQSLSFHYDGKMLSFIEDNVGRRIHYTYVNGYLSEVFLANGTSIKYLYSQLGILSAIYDGSGKCCCQNEYDRNGRVIVQKIEGEADIFYHYDDANKINSKVFGVNRNRVLYMYGNQGMLNQIKYPDETDIQFRYDQWKHVIFRKDRKGSVSTYHYDCFGNRKEESYASGLTIKYEYDDRHNVIQKSDNAGRFERFGYDEKGNQISHEVGIREGRSYKEYREYDNRGRITAKILPNGEQFRFFYDATNFGATKVVTPLGEIIYITYDENGNILSMQDSIGRREYEYDIVGNLVMSKDECGYVTQRLYDANNQLSEVILNDESRCYFAWDNKGNCRKIVNRVGAEMEFDYDDNCKCIKSIQSQGGVRRNLYDVNGNLVKMIRPEYYDTVLDDGPGDTYEYDCMNRLVSVRNDNGEVTRRLFYNLCGNVSREIIKNRGEKGGGEEANPGIIYKYDLRGKVIEKRIPLNARGDENNNVHFNYRLQTYTYDEMGNCITNKVYLDYQTIDSYVGRVNVISRSYDGENRLVKIIDSTKAEMEFQYDDRNRVILEKIKKTDGIYFETKFVYAPNGNILKYAVSEEMFESSMTSPKYRITLFKYDKVGRLVNVISPSKNVLNREYSEDGRLIRESYQNKEGEIVKEILEENGMHEKSIPKKNTDDNLSLYDLGVRNTIANDGGTKETLTYDASDNIIGFVSKDSPDILLEYDVWNRIVSIAVGNEKKAYFSYDLLGNRICGEEWITKNRMRLPDKIVEILTDKSTKSLYHYIKTQDYKTIFEPAFKEMDFPCIKKHVEADSMTVVFSLLKNREQGSKCVSLRGKYY